MPKFKNSNETFWVILLVRKSPRNSNSEIKNLSKPSFEIFKDFDFLLFLGTHPNVNEGIVSATGCVVESSEECCGMKLDLAIKNCTDFTVYRLIPPPVCSIGYCAGHRLPCPEGLTSADGFTPCECK